MKTFFTIIIGIAIILFAFSMMSPKKEVVTLTEQDALVLLGDQLPFVCLESGDGDAYSRCTITVSTNYDGAFQADVVYDGLFDDSVRAIKVSSIIEQGGDGWIVHPAEETYRCHQGRGQQDFETQFCL